MEVWIIKVVLCIWTLCIKKQKLNWNFFQSYYLWPLFVSLYQTSEEEAEGAEGGEAAEEEQIVYKYVPPEPKEWVSLGSEREIEEENVTVSRKTVSA